MTDTPRCSLPVLPERASRARARIAGERYPRIRVSLEAILAHATRIWLNTCDGDAGRYRRTRILLTDDTLWHSPCSRKPRHLVVRTEPEA